MDTMDTPHRIDLTTTADPQTLRDAIARPELWWTTAATREGDDLLISFGDGHSTRFRVEDDGATWRCVDQSESSFADPREWVGTHVTWDVEDSSGGSRLRFAHVGLPELECFERCDAGWRRFLPSLVAVAEGRPGTPRQVV